MRHPALVVLLLLVAGCDTGQENTLPVVQIVGADLRFDESGVGPSLNVWPETREVDRVPAAPCGGPTVDCAPGETVNRTVPEQTRLVADRPVRVGGVAVAAGDDLLAALDGAGERFARERMAVYPFSVSSLSATGLAFQDGRTRLTASWETDDGLAFSSTVSVRR